jgi:hypothetical protein
MIWSAARKILHVTSAILGSLKAQRFTTKKRHGFRFDLTQTTRRGFTVSEIYLSAMAQYYVTKFVQKSLKRELRKWVNRDLALLCKTLNISVRVIEWNALDAQHGNRNRLKFLPVSLA